MQSTDSAASQLSIDVRGLVKRFHLSPVLNNLSLSLQDGDLCVLVGANGAGKTTLLRILAGLSRPSAGQVLISGLPLNGRPAVRRNLGYIGHQPMFYEDLSALENLRHYARLYGIQASTASLAERIQSAGLAAAQNQPVRTCSRGMQQRLSIERALLHNPHILLLDEPYTGLDQDAAQQLDRRLAELHTPGRTILIAAHRPQRLLTLASHIAWLQEGSISHHLPTTALNNAPELLAYLQEVP
jgi:heme exporter protein A